MKSERSWAGIICGFVLFIVVCLSLLLHMKGAFRASGNPELGLLFFFCCRGRRRAVSLLGRRVLRPLLGAILAAPVCMVTMRLFFVTHRTFWQEMAWVLSAVFWCALGALCFLFICARLDTRRSHSSSK
ncbi:inner membrane protein YbjM [Klebsiella pneumoniae]|nr:inner membrane protein YbjM [Klebsiella pneumoniae]